jgi:hypothetical protein
MKISELPPVEVLREHFTYDPESGEVKWKKKTHARNRIKVGDVAGSTRKDGYRRIMFMGVNYFTHRIAWALHYGKDPYPHIVDHKRGVEQGNGIDNLRLATDGENIINAKRRKDNTSGHRGVRQRKDTGKWVARIDINGEPIWLGCFKCKEDAITARLKAEAENNIFIFDR